MEVPYELLGSMHVDIRPTVIPISTSSVGWTTAKYGKRLANSQSSRYWKSVELPYGSTGGCNTAPGRRDARGKHTRINP
ncbi:hypothetical protein TNIN_204721 [Trichonephila inaurata madagascariensis]|uniref:Uncharacterized protein n=1 Tax=Trichonephila inaurata madagascariensis TaxID=2747483 RepID=A0A8X6YDC0_9ARAC|nr:hypothetical protein TNIN_204721 [Trichonephila inaurata madagascariensis]